MSGPDGKLSSLAQRMRAAGASVVTDAEGRPIITMPAGGLKPKPGASQEIGANSAGELKAFIERIERLDEERQGIVDDIKDVFLEAKHSGFDPKILRKIIKIRKDPDQYREESELVDVYLQALGIEP